MAIRYFRCLTVHFDQLQNVPNIITRNLFKIYEWKLLIVHVQNTVQ